MFLCDLVANFGSREINVKPYTRIINGKAVPVKGGRRTVLAIREALNDLRKIGSQEGIEGAYLMNPRTGKVGQYTKGGIDKVNAFDNISRKMKNASKTRRQRVQNKTPNRHILHNHPISTSLSSGDLRNTSIMKQVHAVNDNGSRFRAYIKNKDGFSIDDHYNTATNIAANLFTKHPKINPNEGLFLATHISNLKSQNTGDIFYRAKLTPKDKNILKKYKTDIDNFLNTDLTAKPTTTSTALVNEKLSLQQAENFKLTKPNTKSKSRLENRRYIVENLPTYDKQYLANQTLKDYRRKNMDNSRYDYAEKIAQSNIAYDNWLTQVEELKAKGLIN